MLVRFPGLENYNYFLFLPSSPFSGNLSFAIEKVNRGDFPHTTMMWRRGLSAYWVSVCNLTTSRRTRRHTAHEYPIICWLIFLPSLEFVRKPLKFTCEVKTFCRLRICFPIPGKILGAQMPKCHRTINKWLLPGELLQNIAKFFPFEIAAFNRKIFDLLRLYIII